MKLIRRLSVCTAVLLSVLLLALPSLRAQSDTSRDSGSPSRPPVVVIKASNLDLDRRAFDFYCSGLALETLGDFQGAAANYQKALEFFPGSKEIGLSLANVYFNGRHPDEALDILKSIIPRDARVWSLAAACYRLKGDDKSAFDAYHKAVALDSNDVVAYSFLGGYFQMVGQTDSAISAYQAMVRIQPNNYRVWFEIGRLRALLNDNAGAKEAIRQSLSIEPGPENANALQALTEIYVSEHLLDSAKALLKAGLEHDRANLQLRNKLIGIYIQQDSMLSALPHAKFVADSNPLDKFALRRLAMLYFTVDSLDSSQSIFSALEKSGDDNPTVYYYLGRIAILKKDNKNAVENFRKLITVADTSSSAWFSLGLAYRELGQKDKEIETYRVGIEHMRSETGAIALYYALGSSLEQADLIDSSVAVFEELIKHSPDNPQALNYLGYMLADRSMRLDYAKELLTRAISLDPQSPAIMDSYAWVHFRTGELDTALIYLQKAAELDTDATIFDHLGDVYKAKGNLEQARHWWNRALEVQPQNPEIRKKLGQ